MKFEEHGIFTVEVKDNIMIVDARGPFNEETGKSYKKALEAATTHIYDKPWGQVVILHGLSLFTPDAAQIVYETTVWRLQNNLVAGTVVLKEPEAEEMIRTQMLNIYNKAGLDFAFCESIEDALAWLKPKFQPRRLG